MANCLIQKFTKEELEELKEYDKMVDRAKASDILPYDLNKEQKQIARSMTQADRDKTTKTVYNFNKRERKANDDKRVLVKLIETALAETKDITDIVVNNQERELEFVYNDKKYKVVLSAPRK